MNAALGARPLHSNDFLERRDGGLNGPDALHVKAHELRSVTKEPLYIRERAVDHQLQRPQKLIARILRRCIIYNTVMRDSQLTPD